MKNNLKSQNVFVTGGHGFIGSHLVKKLLYSGANVSILAKEHANLCRIKTVLKDIQILNGDIKDTDRVQEIITQIQPDYLFHLAADSGHSPQNNTINKINTNILGTTNIMEAIKRTGCKKIINLGSSSEYGVSETPIHENTPLNPQDVYGITKLAATQIAHHIAMKNKINIVTLRPFNVFGEAAPPENLFGYIISRLIQNQEVFLSKCIQTRDYCYIENIITGMILAATKSSLKNEIFNIGSGDSHPLKYFVKKIFQHFDSKKEPHYGAIPYSFNERMHVASDVSKIKKVLDWKITISLEQGIEKTIEWYQSTQNK
ncbi:SDR family NAD(P)-dependent oxidoreductase [Bacillus cereus group sp. Bc252]|uniref:NAD-dependent epimerase/dehydratase family protein n=1 Tax=Bacillus TaxID=1386 RepID=UPI0021D03C2E|nr:MULTISPECIES: SDR family NAD(P)-dependent oxidoreductase [Bacillus cereus group]MCU5208696.1 SDR family NAD(P)-dependent oxidoreductase [Bacillus paranthracis]MDA2164120.1 SDR family NAD(P)-dependent oxidoreductase [Bacillus cereus group sp. Bc252]MDF9512768.1 SDR family NAD(P)-dependent oxidoreductase [Bacillus paranthracis]MDF9672103.1 SDR family NAD(P)-dependent oxidoreductase [Bacillus paranthracis]MDG1611787.1 SDR family NAD(P)-dependent oxidoreductase [Bacillus paranthracis]